MGTTNAQAVFSHKLYVDFLGICFDPSQKPVRAMDPLAKSMLLFCRLFAKPGDVYREARKNHQGTVKS
ncbi:hypothetical protein D3C85_1926000 [compost metagenome]